MNNYRKFVIAYLGIELILIVLCNIYLIRGMKTDGDRSYKVDIARAVDEMQNGTSMEDIDIDQYKTIIAIRRFHADEICNQDYTVEEVDGELYRFEYQQERSASLPGSINILLGIIFISTLAVLLYIEKKIIKPFYNVCELPTELAKGNLSVPIQEEKSRFFGKFLWGMDMLREKLEQDKATELELIKEKKTLILALSHDIKTPLAAIDLYTKALLGNLYNSKGKQRDAMKGIAKNAETIRHYVDEIVLASREDFLNFEVVCTEFYLAALIDNIMNYYQEKMQRTHTEFMVDVVENCLIYGDFNRAVEVLQNICENAIKYGDGKYVHISFAEEESCKLITIENTGCTLSEEELTNIFDSFYRGSNSENIRGSGLGLYICKELLHRMDGELFAKLIEDRFAMTIVLRKTI